VLSVRSYRKELLDAEEIPVEDLYRNLRELEFINTYLGGHAVTVKGLARLAADRQRRYRILDIGSGGGDTLRYIARWGRKHGYQFELTGVDLKDDCIRFATAASRAFPEIRFIRSDYRDIDRLDLSFDIITSSLFCHHLDDEQLTGLLHWMKDHAQQGFIVNDLHRHTFAYYSIKWLTAAFSGSYLVKNDAPLSVQRGFSRKEIKGYIAKAGITSFALTWKWAFRWLLIADTRK
jgi:2-polyprenyl-3-methyl-5-hydroxy-6-metoxy-1,4-benzoquinol methylase